jgi:hypothetical protein
MHIKTILTREKILNYLAIGVMIALFCLAALRVIEPLYAFGGVLLWMTAFLGRIEKFIHEHTIEYDVLHTDYVGGVWRFWIGGNAVNLDQERAEYIRNFLDKSIAQRQGELARKFHNPTSDWVPAWKEDDDIF